MKRRAFIGTLAGGLLVAPLVAEAQGDALWRGIRFPSVAGLPSRQRAWGTTKGW
jgi:hypothetical protein